MTEYTPSTYGDAWAEIYDDEATISPPGEVEFLAEVAGDGPVLELGVGTGRVAVPLAERGLEMHGLDPSQGMLARLREKSDRVEIHDGVMDGFDLGLQFSLVYVVFSTIFAPLTQEEQLATFRTVARHLSPGGAFVVQAFVPDLTRFDRGQRLGALDIGVDRLVVEATKVDRAQQLLTGQRVVVTEEGARLYPLKIRFAYPPELDLMARLVGLRLRDRWADFERTPYDSASDAHVSVYGKEPA
jgi:SAM-dependent methyltransferase